MIKSMVLWKKNYDSMEKSVILHVHVYRKLVFYSFFLLGTSVATESACKLSVDKHEKRKEIYYPALTLPRTQPSYA